MVLVLVLVYVLVFVLVFVHLPVFLIPQYIILPSLVEGQGGGSAGVRWVRGVY